MDQVLDRVDGLVEDVLWPASGEVDRADGLRIENFKSLSALGLYGMVVDRADGGLGFTQPAVRAVFRRLGSGCASTAFAFAQHHGTVAAVASTENDRLRDRWLSKLTTDRLAGIGYAHVRRGGPPVLVAEPDGEGWIFNGSAPWVTSWGYAETFGILAKVADGRMVWALVPGHEQDGLTAGDRFALMVLGSTQTVPLYFQNFRVTPDEVLSVVDGGPWAARDRLLAARPNPLSVGIGDRALMLLEAKAPDLAVDLAPWWADITDRAEAQCVLVDNGTADITAVADSRAEVLAALQQLTTALVAATGGSAMEYRNPAQRLAREAMFYVVQAQSADGRAASLRRLGPSAPA